MKATNLVPMRIAGSLLIAAAIAHAQSFEQRGYFETALFGYPQTAPNDSGQAIGEATLRYDGSYKPIAGLRFAASIEAQTDTHHQTDRGLHFSWFDRTTARPALAIRRLSAIWSQGKLTVEMGKQLIRWGKTDVLNPTDRFAPRDYLNVVDNDFLGVTAARLTYGTQSNTIEVIYSPQLTPSRIPLMNQRWANAPTPLPMNQLAPDIPGGSQFGARWNHIGNIAEYSLSFYDGYDNLPVFRWNVDPVNYRLDVQRVYPQMRMYGGDAAVPLGPVNLKGEAAYFTSTNPLTDEYALGVVQLERIAGEWNFALGYAGQVITDHRSVYDFSPTRGFARAAVLHAGYTIDVNRSVLFEGIVRQNGRGTWLRAEYTQALGPHWRVTVGAALVRGDNDDFIGQYHRNSYGILRLRYSF